MNRRTFIASSAAVVAATGLPAPAEPATDVGEFYSPTLSPDFLELPKPPFNPNTRFDESPPGSLYIHDTQTRASNLNQVLEFQANRFPESNFLLSGCNIECDVPLRIPASFSDVVITGCKFDVLKGVGFAVMFVDVDGKRTTKTQGHTAIDSNIFDSWSTPVKGLPFTRKHLQL